MEAVIRLTGSLNKESVKGHRLEVCTNLRSGPSYSQDTLSHQPQAKGALIHWFEGTAQIEAVFRDYQEGNEPNRAGPDLSTPGES